MLVQYVYVYVNTSILQRDFVFLQIHHTSSTGTGNQSMTLETFSHHSLFASWDQKLLLKGRSTAKDLFRQIVSSCVGNIVYVTTSFAVCFLGSETFTEREEHAKDLFRQIVSSCVGNIVYVTTDYHVVFTYYSRKAQHYLRRAWSHLPQGAPGMVLKVGAGWEGTFKNQLYLGWLVKLNLRSR